MPDNPTWTVIASQDTDRGGHTVTVGLPDGRRIVVRVPPARATSTGIRQAIEAAVATQRPPGGVR